MEDTPDLFDSEPMSINLKVPDNPELTVVDNVLTKMLGEIQETKTSDKETAESSTTDTLQENSIEYHTDLSEDDDIEGAQNQTEDASLSVNDESAAQLENNTPKSASKTKDVYKGLPPGRVKLIMKMDPDVNIIAADAVLLLTKATVRLFFLKSHH